MAVYWPMKSLRKCSWYGVTDQCLATLPFSTSTTPTPSYSLVCETTFLFFFTHTICAFPGNLSSPAFALDPFYSSSSTSSLSYSSLSFPIQPLLQFAPPSNNISQHVLRPYSRRGCLPKVIISITPKMDEW